jgi:hypothetical protein
MRILDFSDGFTSVSAPTAGGNYSAVYPITVDQPENTIMTLLNSETYVVGVNQLYVSLNGQLLEVGIDYDEIGSNGSISTQIKMLQNLVIGDRLVIRK